MNVKFGCFFNGHSIILYARRSAHEMVVTRRHVWDAPETLNVLFGLSCAGMDDMLGVNIGQADDFVDIVQALAPEEQDIEWVEPNNLQD